MNDKSYNQTAVEWFANQLGITSGTMLEQAIEMHRQEIIDAYDKGEFDCGCNGSAEQYYNKTFKKD